jgi:glutathione S-transferase
MQPLILHGGHRTPNLMKVAIILTELAIPFEVQDVLDPKDPSFVALNPNGRKPALTNPNVKPPLVLFETGAIIEYLVETFDKDGKLTYGNDNEEKKWKERSWLHFQTSGQGPYFGQRAWFMYLHEEVSQLALIWECH